MAAQEASAVCSFDSRGCEFRSVGACRYRRYFAPRRGQPRAADRGSARRERVLVTGATGFIGRWTARALAQAGADLHVVVRRETSPSFGVSHRRDLARPGELAELIKTLKPSKVFNLCVYGVDRRERDENLAWRLNRDLVLEAGRALADTGGRLIHVGSALEYGEVGGDLRETGPVNATTLYGRSKLEASLGLRDLAREKGLQAVTARMFSVYGPGEHPGRLLPSLVSASEGVGVVPLSEGLQKRDFTYVEDVVENLLKLSRASFEPGEIVNLASGRLTTVRDFVCESAKQLGIGRERLAFGSVPVRGEEMAHDPINIDRQRALLGPVTWDSVAGGLRRTVARLADGSRLAGCPIEQLEHR